MTAEMRPLSAALALFLVSMSISACRMSEADAVMKPTAALQGTLFAEMVGHIKEDDDTAPYRRGN